MTVLTGARVVGPSGVLDSAWVDVRDGRIEDIGDGPAQADAVDLEGGWLLPGFIDAHMHGGGGHDVTRSADDLTAAVAFHRAHGTTRTLVSLMAAPVDSLCAQLGWVHAASSEDERILGAHLEGPFLSAARCGAQNHDYLREPDRGTFTKLLDASQGSLRTVTVAPELPGALDLIEEIASAGVVAAIGHTEATYEQAMAGFRAGAVLATHLFNAMGAVSQRAPGTAVAALEAAGAVEIINDGVHVHDALIRLVAGYLPERLVFITDAISATGVGDGSYTVGDQPLVVRDGHARLAGLHNLAGHRPRLDADLVLLDDDLRVRRVMVGGAWL